MTIAATILIAASMLTGRPGTVVSTDMTVCPATAYGCADIRGNVIHMRPDLVQYLNLVVEGRPASGYMTALAAFVFGHEARHVRGTYSERVADAWAKSHAVTIVRLLGGERLWAVSLRPLVALWDRRMSV